MALERVEGVEAAQVSYETGSSTVTFDPRVTTASEFIGELERLTDFRAEVVEKSDALMPMPDADSVEAAEHSH